MVTFECVVAVWTGARETPLECVLSASELDAVAGRLRVSLSAIHGVLLSRAARVAPTSHNNHRTKHQRVLLAAERFRSFAVYRFVYWMTPAAA